MVFYSIRNCYIGIEILFLVKVFENTFDLKKNINFKFQTKMKKLFLIATIGVAGFLSANSVVNDSNKSNLTKIDNKEFVQQYCQEYVMVVWCDKSKNTVDTVCYELGNAQSKNEAYECMAHNGRLFNIYNCGAADYGLTNSIY